VTTAAGLEADITRLAARWRETADLALADAEASGTSVTEAAAVAAALRTCADMAEATVAGAQRRDVLLAQLRREGLTPTGRQAMPRHWPLPQEGAGG
jgi:hypothetical protein